jgi:hypothetical protein
MSMSSNEQSYIPFRIMQKRSVSKSFWDLSATPTNWFLLAFGAICCGLLHLSPVLNSAIALPLTIVMAAVCYLSPLSGFFFLGCNQFLPYPEGAAFNPAQIGFIVWVPAVIIRYRKFDLRGFRHFIWVVPWFGWHTLMTGMNVLDLDGEYTKAFLYAVIGLQLANESRGKYLQCLFGLACGALMVCFAYWGITIGLPVEVSDWGGEREGFTRMGSVRADSVMVWPAILIAFGAFLGLAGAFASKVARKPPPGWLLASVILVVLLCLPPLAGTMTHSAYAGLALMVIGFIGLLGLGGTRSGSANASFASRVKIALATAAFAAVALFLLDAFQMRSRSEALTSHFDDQSVELGVMASRTDVWKDALNTIFRYPLTGYRFVGGTEQITSHYAASGGYLAHNVFLDYGRYGGIPGLVFVSAFFFAPAVRLWRHPLRWQFMPFLMVFIAIFTFWMVLSFQFYKTVWALWPLMMRAADMPGPTRLIRNPRRRKSTSARGMKRHEAATSISVSSSLRDDVPTTINSVSNQHIQRQ